MIDLLARRSVGGDIYLNLARTHLEKHEWGDARRAVLRGLEKGNLSDEPAARQLLARVSAVLGLRETGEGDCALAASHSDGHRRIA